MLVHRSVRNLRPWLAAVPALLFIAVFFLWPMLEVLLNSLRTADSGWGVEHYRRLLTESTYIKVLGNTLLIAFVTAILCATIGYPFAFLLSQMDLRQRGRWLIWLLIPFWTSYLVKTFSWILLLSRSGVFPQGLSALGVDSPALVPSLGAVLTGMVHAMLPIAVMSMLPIMQGINRQLSSAARTLGAGPATAFFSVFLPLSLPGVAAAGLLVFITSLGFFIVPALLGSPKETMTAQVVISVVMELFNMQFAGALAALLLLAAVAVLFLYDRLVGLNSISGGEQRVRRSKARRKSGALWVWLGRGADRFVHDSNPEMTRQHTRLKCYTAFVILLLMLPIAVVVPISFTSSSFLSFPPRGFSLQWYETFLVSPVWRTALLRSVGVATATAMLSVMFGFGAALTLSRVNSPAGKALFAFLLAPLVLPRIVIAVGLFYLFARMGLLGTEVALVIGHCVLGIPYVVVTLTAALSRFDWRLDDAALTMGASLMARVRTVMVPLLLPSMTSAFLFAFLTSFDELTIALFISGGLSTTLPKQMWDDMVLQVNPTLAAVSVLMLLAVSLSVLVLTAVRRDRLSDA